MNTITVKDGTTIYYKAWGSENAQPIVFHHGWPLSADDWDTQMLYFLEKGIASSRMTAAVMAGRARSAMVTTWTTTLRTPPPSWSISVCAMPSTSAIRPAAAKRRAMSRATARAVSPSSCLSAPCRL